MLILYHDLTCFWSRAIRLALAEKGEACELRTFDEDSLAQGLTTPHLIDDRHGQGLQITDGRIIMEYLDEAFEHNSLMGALAAERAEVRRLTNLLAEPFWQQVGAPLYEEKVIKLRQRRVGLEHAPFNSRGVRTAQDAFVSYAKFIGEAFERNRWLGGNFFSMADAMAMGQVSALDFAAAVPWAELSAKAPSFRSWYALAKSRPVFGAIYQDSLPDIKPPAHYANPDF